MGFVCRHIPQNILTAQFGVNEVDIIVELVEIVREKGPSSRHIHDALQFSAACAERPDLTDGVYLDIHLLGKLANFGAE